MALKLDRSHVAETPIRRVTWDVYAGSFVMPKAKKIGDVWQDVPVENFCMDIWLAQHGWRLWEDKRPTYVWAAVSDDKPKRPGEDAKPCYKVPVWGAHLGGMRELEIEGKGVVLAFIDLMDSMARTIGDLDEMVVPIMEVTRTGGDYGYAPKFVVENLIQRPDGWPTPIVSFR